MIMGESCCTNFRKKWNEIIPAIVQLGKNSASKSVQDVLLHYPELNTFRKIFTNYKKL